MHAWSTDEAALLLLNTCLGQALRKKGNIPTRAHCTPSLQWVTKSNELFLDRYILLRKLLHSDPIQHPNKSTKQISDDSSCRYCMQEQFTHTSALQGRVTSWWGCSPRKGQVAGGALRLLLGQEGDRQHDSAEQSGRPGPSLPGEPSPLPIRYSKIIAVKDIKLHPQWLIMQLSTLQRFP